MKSIKTSHEQKKPILKKSAFFNHADKVSSEYTHWKWLLLGSVILSAAVWAAYLPSLHYDFQFDDLFNIKKFFSLRSQTFREWAFGGPRWISYALNSFHYQLDKFTPFVYRRSNVIFHSTTGIFIFFVTYLCLKRLTKQGQLAKKALIIAFITALLFLLHPVQTQTVSYIIQGQLEGLALMCVMAIILCYLVFQTTASYIAQGISFLFLIFFAIASCGTKEIAILSPLMLVLIDWFFIAKGDPLQLKKRVLFFIGYTTLIAFQYARYLDLVFFKNSILGKATLPNNVGNVITNHNQTINPASFFISQFKVILHYIAIFFWPFNISVEYDWKMTKGFFTFECIVPLIILIACGIGTLLLLRNNRTHIIAFCSLWFFIGLSPRTTFIPSTELLVDYKTYFSSFGILLLIALGIVFLFDAILKKIFIKPTKQQTLFSSLGAVACFMCLLGYSTYSRNLVWKSSENFWMSMLQNAPKKARAYNNYAVAIAEKGRFDEAIPYFKKAIQIDKFYPDPWSNVSVCYASTGKNQMAIDCLRQAIKINPDYPEFYNNLSSYVLQHGKTEECKKLAQHAISLRPHYGKAYFNWGQALYNEGNKEEAHQKIKYACMNADYDTPESFKVYAELSVELQKFEDALQGYSHLLALQPDNKDTYFNIANAHFFLDHHKEAEQIYKALTTADPTEYRCWLNLGELYHKTKNLNEALRCYEKAQPIAYHHPNIRMRIAECKKMLEQSITA